MVVIFSICAALSFGLSDFMVRVGLKYSNARSAALFSTISGLIVSALIGMISVSWHLLNVRGALYFILAGIAGAFIARYLLYVGMEKVGVSIAISLAGISPLFGSIIAVMILGEQLTMPIAGSTLLIIAGAIAISWDTSGGHFKKTWSRKDLIFPILSSFSYGLAYVLRKMGVNDIPDPVIGVLIQNAVALTCFMLAVPFEKNHQKVDWRNARAWIMYGISGLFGFFANYLTFSALKVGQVVIVAPLISLNPLFTLALAWLFLRNLERVTWQILLGTFFIICGAAILSLASHR